MSIHHSFLNTVWNRKQHMAYMHSILLELPWKASYPLQLKYNHLQVLYFLAQRTEPLPAPQLSVAPHTLMCRHRIITAYSSINPPAIADYVPALPSWGWKGKEVIKHLLQAVVIWKPMDWNHVCPWSLPCMTALPHFISWRQSSLGSAIPACFKTCLHPFNTIMKYTSLTLEFLGLQTSGDHVQL